MNERKIYALGFFDGVHLGHQALLEACCRLAKQHGCGTAAVTFDVPPSTVLHGQPARMITTQADRTALLEQHGIRQVQVYPATAQLLAMPWEDFLVQLQAQGAAGFVCGNDFRFGCKGAGNADLLQAFCLQNNLHCVVVPEQIMDGERISSTRIRTLLEQGQIPQANRLLGHPYSLSGTVISGQQLGRTISIPTANLQLPEGVIAPKLGVYACKVSVDGTEHLAVTNVGNRPTVAGTSISVETFLLDFQGDLYGKFLHIAFYQFLRPEKKFANLTQLGKEIQENIVQTRNFFEKSE